jgi:hypothetical protein
MTWKVPQGNVKNTGYSRFALHGRLAYSGGNRHQIIADKQ